MQKKVWQKAEDKCCKEFGAKLTPRSGAGPVVKGDCIANGPNPGDRKMYEVKSSTRKDKKGHFITLSADWFETVKDHAFASGRDPFVYLCLGEPLQSFLYMYDPFCDDIVDNTEMLNKTLKLYLSDFEEGVPIIYVKGNAWRLIMND